MKKYTAPELEIMEFELEDVLTASTPLGKNWSDFEYADQWQDA